MLTYEQYQQKKALLGSGGNFSPEAVAKVQAALDEYDNHFLAAGAAADEKPLAPGEPDRLLSVGPQGAPVPTTNEGLAQQLLQKLDPSKPLAPQVLAISPATTHPKGDEAAKNEWVRGELSNPKGTVIAYDAPVAIARKDLLENPALFRLIGYDAPLTPDKVMSIQQGDSVHQAYNDYKWREAANAATAAGKTAYRYSKAPYLPDGKGAGLLDTLSTKIKAAAQPYGQGVTAFMLGVDKGADFGIGRGAYEAVNPTVNEPHFGQDQTGGMPQGLDARTHDSILQEEHPKLYLGGEALGALAPWSLANRLFGWALGGAGRAAAALGGGELAQGLAQGGATIAGSALGGAAVQGANEAVKAGSSLQQTGSAGTTLPEAASRVVDAGEVGGLFGTLGAAAQGVGSWVRTGSRYGGLPETVEKLNGGKVYPVIGHATPPVVSEAEQAARARSIPVKPVDILAERAQGPLTEAAKTHVENVNREVGEATSTVKASPEGKELLPLQKTAETALSQLRERTASIDGEAPTPVGIPNADDPIHGIFNANIEGVSVSPRKGWLPMKVSEAESFFNPVWRKRALRATETPDPVMRPGVKADALAVVPEAGGLAAREPPLNPDQVMDPEAGWRNSPGAQRQGGPDEQAIVRANGGDASLATAPDLTPRQRAPGAAHPELEASNTRFSPEGPDWRPGPRPPPEPGVNTEPTGGGPMLRGSRPQRPTEATAREVGPTGEGPPRNPKFSVNYDGPTGSRWQRRGSAAPETGVAPVETGDAWRENIKPGTFTEEMKRRGVDTVYVAPRRVDATRHQTVIRQLRRAGGDNANDRDIKAIYEAALEDRDARSINGKPGAWSEMQQKNKAMIREAKATQKRAAPNEDAAYRNMVGIAEEKAGQSKTVRALEDTAARAGGNTLDLLRGARVMGPLAKVQAAGGFGNRIGGMQRSAFGLSALGDALMLRGIYPITRAAEHNPLGQVSLLGADDSGEVAKRRARDQALVPGYQQQVGAMAPPPAQQKVKRRPLRKD